MLYFAYFYVRLELAKKTWRLICQLLVCKFSYLEVHVCVFEVPEIDLLSVT